MPMLALSLNPQKCGTSSTPILRAALLAEYLFLETQNRTLFSSLGQQSSTNECSAPEGNFGNAGNEPWQKANVTVTDYGFADPFGGQRGSRVVSGEDNAGLIGNFHDCANNATYTQSVWVANNGETDITIRFLQFSGSFGPDINLPAKVGAVLSWVQISDTGSAAGTDATGGLFNNAAHDLFDIIIYGFQLERGIEASNYVPGDGTAHAYKGSAYPTLVTEGIDLVHARGLYAPVAPVDVLQASFYCAIKWPSDRTDPDGFAWLFENYGTDIVQFLLDGQTGSYSSVNIAQFGGVIAHSLPGMDFFRDSKWHIWGFTYDGTTLRILVDDMVIAEATGSSSAMTVDAIELFGQRISHNYNSPGVFAYASFYSSGHSVAQWRANAAAITAYLVPRPVAIEPIANWVIIEGDSISTTYAGVTLSYAQSGLKSLSGAQWGIVQAMGGSDVAAMVARQGQLYANFLPGKTIVLSILCGVNNLNEGDSAAQAFTALSNYIIAAKAAAAAVMGCTLKVIVGTILDTNVGTAHASIPAYNALISAAEGTLFDSLFDFAALNLDPAGADFQDGLHPTQTCNDTKLRGPWLAALAAALA